MHWLRAATVILIANSLAANAVAQQSARDVRPGEPVRVNAFGTIHGNALTSTSAPLADALVRLRDARRGRIVDTARTDRTGLFVFHGIEPGTYVVELVAADQSILAASELLNVNAGDTVSAIVKLPFRIQPYAGVVGHKALAAILVTAAAAATGVLAAQVTGEAVSPRR